MANHMFKHFNCKKLTATIKLMSLVLFVFSIQILTTPIYAQDSVSSTLLTEMYSSGEEESNPKIPYNLFISNASSTSFTVNWITKEATTGSVIYAKNTEELSKRTLDKRDSIDEETARFTHSIDIIDTSLAQGDIIYFKLTSNNLEISNDGGNFTFTPPEPLSSPPSPTSQDGTLEPNFDITPENNDFLIIANVDNDSTWISTTPSSEGINWNLSLGNALTSDLTSYADFSNEPLFFSVFGENESTGDLETEISEDPINIPVISNLVEIPDPTPEVTEEPTPIETEEPLPTSDEPTPTSILQEKPLPNTGTEDYLPYIPGIIFLGIGLYFMKAKKSDYLY